MYVVFVIHLLWYNKIVAEHAVNVWDLSKLGTFEITCTLGKITTAGYVNFKREGVYYGQERKNLIAFRIRSSPTVKKLGNV